jgi:uncharacterized protein
MDPRLSTSSSTWRHSDDRTGHRLLPYQRRVDGADWTQIAVELADLGCALLPRLLTVADAHALITLYDRDEAFRSTVTMGRHGFGEGEYRYLAAPLPKAVDALRRALYGDLVFPLQVVINLTEPGNDYTGGEFLVVEQRPRAQSRGTSAPLPHLHGIVFTTRDRPLRTQRGWSAAPVRHAVSMLRSGQRFTLGIPFHNAS